MKDMTVKVRMAGAFLLLAMMIAGQVQSVQAAESGSAPSISLEDVIGDMTDANEMDPHGLYAPEEYQEGAPGQGGGAIEAGNTPPEGWESITMWGSAYEGVAGTKSENTMVAVREPKLYILSKSRNQWIEIVNSAEEDSLEEAGQPLFSGELFAEGFATDERQSLPEGLSTEEGALAAEPGQGLMFHFWPTSGRAALYSEGGVVDENDILGVFVTFQGKLLLEDASGTNDMEEAVFVMRAGADYWEDVETGGQSVGLGYGRFKLVTEEWRPFNFTTLSAEELAAYPLPPGVEDASSVQSLEAVGGEAAEEETAAETYDIQEVSSDTPYTGESPVAAMALLGLLVAAAALVTVGKRFY